jgi:hypothetical protein
MEHIGDTVDLMVGDAHEHVAQIGLGVTAVELGIEPVADHNIAFSRMFDPLVTSR